jgi:hypothetical protein
MVQEALLLRDRDFSGDAKKYRLLILPQNKFLDRSCPIAWYHSCLCNESALEVVARASRPLRVVDLKYMVCLECDRFQPMGTVIYLVAGSGGW